MSVTVGATALVLLGQSPALACCAGEPARSPYAFTGVVIATRSMDRVAVVRTDTGGTVEVRGTPAPAATASSSVDRRYRRGARYEFHPTNASDPYADNACTATRLLPRVVAAKAPAAPRPASLPVADVSSQSRAPFVAGGLIASAAGVIAVVGPARRRRRSAGR